MKIITILLVSAALFSYASLSDASPVAETSRYQHLKDNLAVIEGLEHIFRSLTNAGVKYSRHSMQWAIPTRTAGLTRAVNRDINRNAPLFRSHIIFLEKGKGGDRGAGLAHIFEEHEAQFMKKFNLETAQDISNFIYQVMNNDQYEKTETPYGGGMKVTYKIDESKYLNVGVADNGFIVTAYPSSEP